MHWLEDLINHVQVRVWDKNRKGWDVVMATGVILPTLHIPRD